MIGRIRSSLPGFVRWRYLRWALALPLLPLALWACNSHPLEKPDPRPEQQTDQFYEVNPIRDVDILFAIDNSPSMEQEQANLVRNFPVFMNELKKIPGGLPNVHIAVINTDVGAGPVMVGNCRPLGDRGVFQTGSGCGLNAMEKFIVSRDQGMNNNFTGDIGQVFGCMATVGKDGCGFEHQLQATRVSLYETITTENRGFLRPDAFLAIVVITDEDDCSGESNSDLYRLSEYPGTAASFRCAREGHLCLDKQPPIGEYTSPLSDCRANENGKLIPIQKMVESIRMLKPRPDQQIIVSGIFGWDEKPSATYRYAKNADGLVDYGHICESANGLATAAIRVKAFVDSFGSNNYYDICQDDFSPAMREIGVKLAAKISTPCIEAPLLDMDLVAPEIQADCQVVDRIPSQGGFSDQVIKHCKTGAMPCWNLVEDAQCTASGYKVGVNRGSALAAEGTVQSIKCATCVNANDERCKKT